MKVLQVLDGLSGGGILSVANALFRGLATNGIRQTIFVMTPPRDGHAQCPFLREFVVRVAPNVLLRRFSALTALSRCIREEAPDLIHTHQYFGQFSLGLVPGGRRVPIVSHVHGMAFRRTWRGCIYERAYLLSLRWSDRVVAVSHDTADRLIRQGVQPAKVRVIYNAPPPFVRSLPERAASRTRLGIATDEFVAVFVSRLVPGKRVDVLVEAVGQLAKEWPGIRVLIAGTGPNERTLREQARRAGVQDRVQFLGWVGETSEVLAAADAFVLISDSEGAPMGLLEAMAAGIPCIVNRAGGMPEIIDDGKCGLLLSHPDPSGLARGLRRLATDAPFRQHLVEHASRRLQEKFSLEGQVAAVRGLYEELLA